MIRALLLGLLVLGLALGLGPACESPICFPQSGAPYVCPADADGDGVRACLDESTRERLAVLSDDVPAHLEPGGCDCDDGDAEVFPGATEQANGRDDDCDAATLDRLQWDVDGDGYLPPDDCDDRDPLVHPGAEELCDGIDTDYDGALLATADGDEAVDQDGDGSPACEDCDDGDAQISPLQNQRCSPGDHDCFPDTGPETDFDGDGVTPCEGDCDDRYSWIQPQLAMQLLIEMVDAESGDHRVTTPAFAQGDVQAGYGDGAPIGLVISSLPPAVPDVTWGAPPRGMATGVRTWSAARADTRARAQESGTGWDPEDGMASEDEHDHPELGVTPAGDDWVLPAQGGIFGSIAKTCITSDNGMECLQPDAPEFGTPRLFQHWLMPAWLEVRRRPDSDGTDHRLMTPANEDDAAPGQILDDPSVNAYRWAVFRRDVSTCELGQ